MRRISLAAIAALSILIAFSACSKTDDLSTPEKVYVSILFTPEGFCNIGYNDITLKAIEALSHKYGYEYSFCVPKTIQDGMDYYEAWRQSELEENERCLFVFASKVYEEHLAAASHSSEDSCKDILIFEVEKELPYAYTFAMSYYGAAYMIGKYFLSSICIDFNVIAANPYISGLNYVVDGFTAATEELSSGNVKVTYLDDAPDGGLNDDDLAFTACKVLEYDSGNKNLYIPYAGVSNLGVYRFSQSNFRIAIGVDGTDPNLYSYILLSMNKRMDLALDDFLNLWIKGEEPPRHRLYTLSSGRVVVDRANILSDISELLDSIQDEAMIKEEEYFSKRAGNE